MTGVFFGGIGIVGVGSGGFKTLYVNESWHGNFNLIY